MRRRREGEVMHREQITALLRTMRSLALAMVVTISMLSYPALGEPVTFVDLEGAQVVARIVRHSTFRQGGRRFQAQFQSDFRILIGEGGKIDLSGVQSNGREKSQPM